MNEEIAQMFLTLDAMLAQANQRIANLEFQLRQAHAELARVQKNLAGTAENVEELANREYDRSVREQQAKERGWLGSTRYR